MSESLNAVKQELHGLQMPGSDSLSDPRFDVAVELVLKHEGGLVNDPRDPGGLTKYGISQRSYPGIDIRKLTLDRARAIYRKDWWDRFRYGEITNPTLSIKVFDIAVNIGARRAARFLQRAVNSDRVLNKIAEDGSIGPVTLRAVNDADPAMLMLGFLGRVWTHYDKLSHRMPYYKSGWMARLFDL